MKNTPKKDTPEFWADWLVDAIAGATQDRRYLRGDPEEDKIATEVIFGNGLKAMRNLLAEKSKS